ncbi:MAG: lytic transglycosylase domain-containing protein [Treponema sp.]|nr:lytic transglycosylase domain-containing protein [Treponema sp.]
MPIDVVYPFFCSAVVSVWLCVFSVFPYFEARTGISFRRLAAGKAVHSGNEIPWNVIRVPVSVSELPGPVFNHHFEEQEDAIMTAYRDETRQEWVITFFAEVVKLTEYLPGSDTEEMAAAILANAAAFNISPSLAFALCWTESRFNPQAVNKANTDGSIDRGLFQLNNRSFPKLKEADFFNPSVNAYYGMAHLRWCLDTGGSMVAGLAMYNAGTGRVKAEGAPKRTLDYVSYILDFQKKIEDAFTAHPVPPPVPQELVLEPAAAPEIPEPDTAEPYFRKPRLTLLTPIAGRF